MRPGVADRKIDLPVAGDAGQAGRLGVTQNQRPARIGNDALRHYGLVKQQIGQRRLSGVALAEDDDARPDRYPRLQLCQSIGMLDKGWVAIGELA